MSCGTRISFRALLEERQPGAGSTRVSAGSVRSTRTGFPSGCATQKLTAPEKGEILLEFVVQGNAVKATAIHAATGIEASIVGPANAARETLAQAALRKLHYVMAKKV